MSIFRGLSGRLSFTDRGADTNAQQSAPQPTGGAFSASMAAQMLGTIGAIYNMRARLADVNQMSAKFGGLRDIRNAIAKFGVHPSMLAAVDPKGTELAVIPGIPALESLDQFGLGVDDPRTTAALEGLDAALEQESEVVAAWLTASSDDVSDLMLNLETQIREYAEDIEALQKALDGGGLVEGGEEVYQIPAEQRLEIIHALTEVVNELDTPNYDLDETAQLKEEVVDLLRPLAPMLGLTFIDGVLGIDDTKVAEDYRPRSGTYAELGYTSEALEELLSATASLLGALTVLTEKRAAIVERLKAVAVTVESTKADEGAAQEDDGGAEPNPEGDELPKTGDGTGEEGGEDGSLGGEGATQEDPNAPDLGNADTTFDPGKDLNPEGDGPDGEEQPTNDDQTTTDGSLEELTETEDVNDTARHRNLVGAWLGMLYLVTEASLSTITNTVAIAESNIDAEAGEGDEGGEPDGDEGAGGEGDGDGDEGGDTGEDIPDDDDI